MWMVVGLGNPGPKYEDTRHNIGFIIETELRRRASASAPKSKLGGEAAEGQLVGQRVVFLRPMEFMNLSGQSVGRVAQFWKIEPAQVLVVHDELDVPFARLKLAAGGGAGGHNGLKSIIAHLGTNDFPRVRVGINKPPQGVDTADYVLGRFSPVERKDLSAVIDRSADAVEALLGKGLAAAMTAFNGKDLATL